MKKFFTILILTIFPLAAFASKDAVSYKISENSTLVVNGFVNFSSAVRDQNSSFEQKKLPDGITNNKDSRKESIGNDSQFYVKLNNKNGNLDRYGAVAKVEFNYNSDHRNEKPNLDQAFAFYDGSFGKFEFGNNQAVNQKMKVGPASFARAAGGINGKYLEQVNYSMLANSSNSSSSICNGGVGSSACSNVKLPRFIMLAQSPIGHGGYAKGFYKQGVNNNYQLAQGDSGSNNSHFRALKDNSFDGMEDATKISYYTPRIEGLQMGFSYTPNSNNNGITSTNVHDLDAVRIQDILSFGTNYSNNFDNLGLAISATAEKGKTNNSKSAAGVSRANLFAYDLATTLTYFGFSFGASYGSWTDSLQAKNGLYSCDYNSSLNLSSQNCTTNNTKFKNPSYYTLGIAYSFGPIAASITSIKSNFQKNKYDAVSLGLDYKLTKDLMPYFEVTKFAFKSNKTLALDVAANQTQLRDNSGYVFLTGILFSF